MVPKITGCLSPTEDVKNAKSRCSTLEMHLRTYLRRCINVLTRENEDIFYRLHSLTLDELDLSYEWKLTSNNSGSLRTVRQYDIIGRWNNLKESYEAYALGINEHQKQQHCSAPLHTNIVNRLEHFQSLVDYLLYHVGIVIVNICSARQMPIPPNIKDEIDKLEDGQEQ